MAVELGEQAGKQWWQIAKVAEFLARLARAIEPVAQGAKIARGAARRDDPPQRSRNVR